MDILRDKRTIEKNSELKEAFEIVDSNDKPSTQKSSLDYSGFSSSGFIKKGFQKGATFFVDDDGAGYWTYGAIVRIKDDEVYLQNSENKNYKIPLKQFKEDLKIVGIDTDIIEKLPDTPFLIHDNMLVPVGLYLNKTTDSSVAICEDEKNVSELRKLIEPGFLNQDDKLTPALELDDSGWLHFKSKDGLDNYTRLSTEAENGGETGAIFVPGNDKIKFSPTAIYIEAQRRYCKSNKVGSEAYYNGNMPTKAKQGDSAYKVFKIWHKRYCDETATDQGFVYRVFIDVGQAEEPNYYNNSNTGSLPQAPYRPGQANPPIPPSVPGDIPTLEPPKKEDINQFPPDDEDDLREEEGLVDYEIPYPPDLPFAEPGNRTPFNFDKPIQPDNKTEDDTYFTVNDYVENSKDIDIELPHIFSLQPNVENLKKERKKSFKTTVYAFTPKSAFNPPPPLEKIEVTGYKPAEMKETSVPSLHINATSTQLHNKTEDGGNSTVSGLLGTSEMLDPFYNTKKDIENPYSTKKKNYPDLTVYETGYLDLDKVKLHEQTIREKQQTIDLSYEKAETGVILGLADEENNGKIKKTVIDGKLTYIANEGNTIYIAPPDCNQQDTAGNGTINVDLRLHKNVKITIGNYADTDLGTIEIADFGGKETLKISGEYISIDAPDSDAGLEVGHNYYDAGIFKKVL